MNASDTGSNGVTRILLSGALGHMGRAVAEAAAFRGGRFEVVCGVDAAAGKVPADGQPGSSVPCFGAFPVYAALEDIPETLSADVIIDFSHFSFTRALLDFALRRRLPLVLCTTAISPEDIEYAAEVARTVPVFRSANMSVGIALVKKLIAEAERFLGSDYDVEIVEKHHRRKLDAPSGTALALAKAVRDAADNDLEFVYDRSGRRMPRPKTELGISAVRGGSIVGDHTVMFIGDNETVEISHSARSRSVFADGSLRAAEFLKTRTSGLYGMDDLLPES